MPDIKISAVISTYNEEHNLEELYKSLNGLDELIIVDHGSTDKTIEKAKALGFTVYEDDITVDSVTQDDVTEFKRRFGFEPIFKAGNTMPHGVRTWNAATSYATHDWIFNPDADEFVTWDLKKVKELMNDADIISCKYIQSRDSQGNPVEYFDNSKLFKKSKVWYEGRIHSTISTYGARVAFSPDMEIDHRQTKKDYRQTYLPIIEYTMLKEPSNRMAYYMGREYFNYRMWDKSIAAYQIFLRKAYDQKQIIEALSRIAVSHLNLNMRDKAEFYCFEALKKDPTALEPLKIMASISDFDVQQKWKKIIAAVTS